MMLALALTLALQAAPAATDAAAAPAYDPLLSQIDVRTDVQPRKAALGQEIVWATGVTHPAEGSIGFAADFTGGSFTIKAKTITRTQRGQAVAKIVLAGLDLGVFDLPVLKLRYTTADGADHPFNVLGGKVEIAMHGEPAKQPSALVEPVPIYQWNGWFFGGVAALAALLAAGYLWRRRRPPPPPAPAEPPDPRTPVQRALDAIFQLQTSGMLERREIKAFTYAVDDVVRRFLIETYAAGELAQTSDEFVAALHPLLLAEAERRIAGFFVAGDRVRFAGEEHEVPEAKAFCDAAIALVNAIGASRLPPAGGPA
jgi:hypothetical protein